MQENNGNDTQQVNETTTETPLPGASEPAPKKRRGFAVMDPARVSEIASKGGKAAHQRGTAHEFTPEEAREAGRKGGFATHARRRGASNG